MSIQNVWLQANVNNYLNPEAIRSIGIQFNGTDFNYTFTDFTNTIIYTSQATFPTAADATNAIAAIVESAIAGNATPNELVLINLT